MRQGFDSWFGLPFSHDMRMTVPRDKGTQTAAYYEPKPEYWDVPLMRNNEVIERPVDHRTLTRRYTEEAVRFIGTDQDSSLLLVFCPFASAYSTRAGPTPSLDTARAESTETSSRRLIGARARFSMRCAEGRHRSGERWSSSPATMAHGCLSKRMAGPAGPLTEGKGTTWEGGVRTPAIFWWPGTVRPGVVTDMGSGLDLIVTAAALAGANCRPIE